MMKKTSHILSLCLAVATISMAAFASQTASAAKLKVNKGDTIAFIGGGLGSRMGKFNYFETEIYLRFADKDVAIRNMCDEGDTPGFRPQPGRNHDGQYAFPGAKELVRKDYARNSKPSGHYETPDKWLTRHKTDTIVAFFGYVSSFDGPERLDGFKKELEAFVKHTLAQKYNGKSAPQLVLVSPTAFQDLSAKYGTPDGKKENKNLALYTNAIKEVAAANSVAFVDIFSTTKGWYADGKEYTRDGALYTDLGYKKLAPVLTDAIFGGKANESKRAAIHTAVNDKNWFWFNDYKIPNGVHVYGRRYNPYGPKNYPFELKKTREYLAIRDKAIWAKLKGESFDIAAADAKTSVLPKVETNYRSDNKKNGSPEYLPGQKSQTKINVPDGYKIELFASEREFKNLANPVQIAFDNKGRLWVATMPSYPHWKIGDPLPTDKLLIYEDTDGDGKADKETVFAGDLHLPMGFEFAPEGVYVTQSDSLVLLRDTNGDDKYDVKEFVMSGFDDHDTHHGISAYCADPSGAIYMCEGVFLHSNVETAYGPVRGTNGGFFRYQPQQRKLIRYAQISIPNPWGVAFDDYGQDFFLFTSGTTFSWMLPSSVKPQYGVNMRAKDLLTSEKVRPTSGVEFVSSRHFPDEVQGDVLINNNIGYLGAKQHQMIEGAVGYTTKFRQNLYTSDDRNFRPVDLEFAPDGSLYLADWHNVLIGHMQHNARDPFRDHVHGRIYRVTYPSRPLVKPAQVHGASIDTLLNNLKLHEYRTRYRTRRELRGRPASEVLPALKKWAAKQSSDKHKLEALWVSWGLNEVDVSLLNELMASSDHRIRAAAVRVARFNDHKLTNQAELLKKAAGDKHGRVRMEAITAASWLEDKDAAMKILDVAKATGLEDQLADSHKYAVATLTGTEIKGPVKMRYPKGLPRNLRKSFANGHKQYHKEGYCVTCHQENGKGLDASGFPPLAKTEWVNGDKDRLIKIVLKGLMGPIEVNGKKYPGQVPMMAFEALMNDQQIADTLTFVRYSFGNKGGAITKQDVARVRKEVKGKQGFYNPAELLKMHPMGQSKASGGKKPKKKKKK